MQAIPRSSTRAYLCALVLAAAAPAAWPQASSYAEPTAQSLRLTPLAAATGAASPLSNTAAVGASMRTRGADAATAASLVELSTVATSNGGKHVCFEQRVGGLTVQGSLVKGVFNARGDLVHLIEKVAPIPAAAPSPARIDEARALAAAVRQLHPKLRASFGAGTRAGRALRFEGGAFFHQPPEVTRVLVPETGGALAEGFLVQTWTRRDNLLDNTLVGGDGRVLSVEHRTASDSYNVFATDPERGPQAVVSGPGNGNAQSPSGWLGSGSQLSLDISGNNVRAYLDAKANNAPDPGGTPVTGGNFLTAADLTKAPTTADNRAVGVQNLFYLNNLIHDQLYRHGFDEASGNFQANNFNKGGAGNDPVLAEAQDGGGVSNANFATPTDGSRPRMQMYLWDGADAKSLQRDGDLDADIVFHEYGHGLTWRMIGNMSGPLGGAVGEGASDVVAFMMSGRDVMAPYAYSNPGGIRRYRYGGYPLTYANVKGSAVHDDGEIYAATMWRLRELWLKSGRSNDTLFDVYVDGMRYTPPAPAFEDMRNGMLDSIANTGGSDATARCALVWQAYAQFGIGDGARGVVSGSKTTVTPSTKVRSDCTR